jgi:sortase A
MSKKGAKNSPCRYVGSVYTNDLIICAHNYSSHFGRLKELKQGDEIILVDMNGEIYTYHVELTEEIHRYNVEDMICSGYDLTLFTCTLDAVSRVTVRCTRDA